MILSSKPSKRVWPLPIVGQPRFGAPPVATVAAAPASRVALLVAKMIGQLRPEGTFNQRFLQSPEQSVIARQILGLLVTRKQLIQKFRCQCRGRRHVSSFQKVNSQKPAYTRLLTPSGADSPRPRQ